MQNLKVGVAQIQSGPDAWLNLALVQSFILEAEDRGVDLLCFPENLFFRGPKKGIDFDRQDSFLGRDAAGALKADSPFSEALAETLANTRLTLSFGSVYEKVAEGGLPYNSHWIAKPGAPIEAYHKVHLFNFDSAQGSYREADEMRAGQKPLSVDVKGWRVGLSICFDLRFPELFRELVLREKCELLLVPAAFTRLTGEAHWHTLLRARAIENLAFVAAAGQWGDHLDSKGQHLYCYGHSLIISPWGEVLSEAPAEGDALIVSELSVADLQERRKRLPALSCTRLF